MKQRNKIVCPKCKSIPASLIEVWSKSTIEFEVDENGMWDGEDGYLEPGDAIYVIAECSCGNRWKLRGVHQITEVEGDVK